MSEIKKIISKVFFLLLDILLFAFRIVKQIVLPNKKRKGNILSSLFIFFIGTIGRLIPFEHGLFKMASVFKLRYLRQVVIIIGILLFVLSSFEWTGDQNSFNEQARLIEHLPEVSEKRIKVIAKKQTILCSKITLLNKEHSLYRNLFNSSFTSSTKLFLSTRSLRI